MNVGPATRIAPAARMAALAAVAALLLCAGAARTLSGVSRLREGEAPRAVPVDGEPFPAEPVAIDARQQITFRTADKQRVLPAAGLVSWGNWVEAPHGPLVVLADGSLLAADVLGLTKEHLTAESALFGRVTLALERVAAVIFNPPADPLSRDQLIDRVAAAAGHSDRLILVNGDELTGGIESFQEGKFGIRSTVGPLKVETRRVAAVIFNPALTRRIPAQNKGLRVIVGLRDGSRLTAGGLVLDGKSLAITGADGLPWKTSAGELAALQPLGGQVVYLSDLKPAGYRHVPYLDLSWPYRTDRNVSGGLLRSGGRVCSKGLGMHSAARLSYALSEPYRRFQAELAVDDETGGRGSVTFRVFVDGKVQYSSPIVRGGSPPLPISIDLAGAKRLDLVVDYADRADELDHANWLNARLVR